jgi:hypothetical protein
MPEVDKPDARPFTGFLQEQRRGALHQELSEALAETVAAVIEHGKVGSVTLTLKIKPTGDQMVQIFDGLKVAAPEGEKAPSIFYTDENGNVSRTDPRRSRSRRRTRSQGSRPACSRPRAPHRRRRRHAAARPRPVPGKPATQEGHV